MMKKVFALFTALTLLCLFACPALAAEYEAPYWYPESVTDFEDFHNDPSTPVWWTMRTSSPMRRRRS